MNEILFPGKEVYVRKTSAPHRKTSYDLIGVEHDGVLVSLDSNKPNRFMKRLLNQHEITLFGEYDTVIPEPPLYGGRADFRLEGVEGTKLIEVKSCTLVQHRRALFPDAPTKRGTRHLHDLVMAKQSGLADEVYVVFVIQRPDIKRFAANREMDPAFADALKEGFDDGLQVYALRTMVKDWRLVLLGSVPVDLV
jgi:sugar fermentation stimulation protein A